MSEIDLFLKKKDSRLSLLIDYIGELEPYVCNNLFEFVVHQIMGQMLSEKVSQTFNKRLSSICPELTPSNVFCLGFDKLREIGLSSAKCNCILSFSDEIISGRLVLENLYNLDDDEVVKALTKVKGIGVWTAKMVLIFALRRPNVLPVEDVAFRQGFYWLYPCKNRDLSFMSKRALRWAPYQSRAALYIYEIVNRGMLKSSVSMLKSIES